MPLMNQSEYARHRGVTHGAVQKAIKSGRIAAAVNGKKIDSDMADALWLRNTDQTKPLNSISGNPKHRKTSPDAPPTPGSNAEARAKQDEPEANDSQPAPVAGPAMGQGGGNYAAARAIREGYLARLAKLEFEERAGKLVDSDQVRVTAFNSARKARDMILAIPDRLAPILAGETNTFEVHRILMEELRNVCNEISDGSNG